MDKSTKFIVLFYVLYIVFVFFYSMPKDDHITTYRDNLDNLTKCDPSIEPEEGYICDTGFEHASNIGYLVEKAVKYNYIDYHSNWGEDGKLEYTLQKIVNDLSLYKVKSIDDLETCFKNDKPIYEDDDIIVFDTACSNEFLIARDGIAKSVDILLYNNSITILELQKLGYPLKVVNK